MDIAKRLNRQNIFIFLFLILFPFGQIIRLSLPLFGFNIPVLPIDLIAFAGAIIAIIYKYKKPVIFKYFYDFLFVATLTYMFSFAFFETSKVLYGLFYLVRLWSYVYFFVYVYNFVKSKGNSKLLLNSLLSLSLVSALFGWIQFFQFPDIKPFFVWGWDEHLFRLVGTFLDPTFISLIIVFGFIITIHRCIVIGRKIDFAFALFLLVSLAFTYSRAGYLAFVVGTVYLFYSNKIIGYILYPILILASLIFILPTSKNHSINFFRSFSAIARVENYKETLQIFTKSPIFGVGYNNICMARQKYIGFQDFSSHACSGSDSSLLFILASMGVAGLFSFFNLLWGIGRFFKSNSLIISLGLALLTHSLFSNSLFYPFIMGYLMILLSTQIMEKN